MEHSETSGPGRRPGHALRAPGGRGDLGAGAVDMPAFRALVSRVIAGPRADFLVVLGSTGEAATVADEERDELVRAALEEARACPVIVGTGHNSTAKAVELAARAAAARGRRPPRRHALLQQAPDRGPRGPLPRGSRGRAGPAHHRLQRARAARASTSCPKDLDRLWAIPEVVAVKESSGNLAQIGEILRTMPEGKLLFSGDDALALPAIAMGGHGLISVLGNLLPAEAKALVDAALAGRRSEAAALHARLLPHDRRPLPREQSRPPQGRPRPRRLLLRRGQAPPRPRLRRRPGRGSPSSCRASASAQG